MKFKVFLLAAATFVITSCTQSPESKVSKAIEGQFNKQQLAAETSVELDKLLGKEPSKLKTSIYDYAVGKFKISHSDVKVTGNQATAKVTVVVPKMEEVGGLIFLAAFMPKEKVMNMTINELFKEVTKDQKRQVANNINDMPTTTYVAMVDVEKVNDKWSVKQENLGKLLVKKNIVK